MKYLVLKDVKTSNGIIIHNGSIISSERELNSDFYRKIDSKIVTYVYNNVGNIIHSEKFV